MKQATKRYRDQEINRTANTIFDHGVGGKIWSGSTMLRCRKVAGSLVWNLDKPYSDLTKYDHWMTSAQMRHLNYLAMNLEIARDEDRCIEGCGEDSMEAGGRCRYCAGHEVYTG